ncbi:hypothetical protein HPB50_016148 [Hyalomma asiaticum]|uniref:Uncharacterized protein n=1 Tax=Hyalomma asiaticum TaxID=266040 RepID=A0ACB7RVP4_HYAAI|nr:hypothetical protein HPB50_016148 [Hyalomma asiaticum]
MHVRQQNRDTMQELCLLRSEVHLVSQRLGQAEAADRSPSLPHAQPSVVLPRLPAETISELEAAEAAVQNEAVASVLCKHLLSIGGKGLREVAVDAMKAVMGYDVQLRYSLHGRKGKLAFIQLKLCTIVTGCLNPSTPCRR